MAVLRTVPEPVDLEGWAGDTLLRTVTVPTAFIAGRVWSAQVRASRDATQIDATFVIVEPTTTDGPASIYLRAEDTARLVAGRTAGSARFTSASVGVGYSGVWDVQLAPAGGGDPTTTLAYGQVTLFGDVTRPA
jgi:hypothetical protein